MNPLALLDIGDSIVNKVLDFIPDPVEKAKAAQAAQQAQLDFTKQLMLAQAQTNDDEAKSDDKFTSRARPFILYICGVSVGYTFILQPFLTFGVKLFHANFAPPVLDSGDLMALMTGMLGLAGAHVYDNTAALKASVAANQGKKQ